MNCFPLSESLPELLWGWTIVLLPNFTKPLLEFQVYTFLAWSRILVFLESGWTSTHDSQAWGTKCKLTRARLLSLLTTPEWSYYQASRTSFGSFPNQSGDTPCPDRWGSFLWIGPFRYLDLCPNYTAPSGYYEGSLFFPDSIDLFVTQALKHPPQKDSGSCDIYFNSSLAWM